MSKRRRSRVQSWPRWLISTVASVLVAAFTATAAIFGFGATVVEAAIVGLPVLAVVFVAGTVSEFFGGLLAAALEGMSVVTAVVLAPLAMLEGC